MPFDINENMVIGLIPARGGSKSIPLKNISELGGKPLIDFVIRAGLDTPSLCDMYCSTDHESIAKISQSSGVKVIDRPDEYSGDDAPVTQVILHALYEIKRLTSCMPGMVALLQPTSPFVQASHIEKCVSVLRDNRHADSAQTVSLIPHNLHALNQRIIEGPNVKFRYIGERQKAYNKQRKPKHYSFGNVVVTRSASLLRGSDCFGELSIPVEIPRLYSIDVDTQDDLAYANYLIDSGYLT
jgi:CMP-N,N'-diacetyllegionaminic acid synthase